jgi:hypothetical protein
MFFGLNAAKIGIILNVQKNREKNLQAIILVPIFAVKLQGEFVEGNNRVQVPNRSPR